jgi:RNA polymerase sigma factor (sigma-70 family)
MTTPGEILTSLTLLERVCSDRRHQSDPEAYELFDRLYRPLVYGRCVRIMRLQAADAEDVTLEVLLEVLDRLDTFQRQRPGSFRLFLNQAVGWRVQDFLRDRASANERQLDSGVEIAARTAEVEEITASEVRLGALELLQQEGGIDEKLADLVRLRLVAKMPAKQVGEQLGMSEGAVNTATCRVKKMLRERFRDLLVEDGA